MSYMNTSVEADNKISSMRIGNVSKTYVNQVPFQQSFNSTHLFNTES